MGGASFDSIRRFLADNGFAARVRTVDVRASATIDATASDINTEIPLYWSGPGVPPWGPANDLRLYKRGPLDSNGKMANSTMGVVVGFGAVVDMLGQLYNATNPYDEQSAFSSMGTCEARLYAQQTVAFERIQGSALSGTNKGLVGFPDNSSPGVFSGREQPGQIKIETIEGSIVLHPNDQIDPTCYVTALAGTTISAFQLTHVYRIICADRGEDG